MKFMRFYSRTSYACRIVFNIYITNWYVLSRPLSFFVYFLYFSKHAITRRFCRIYRSTRVSICFPVACMQLMLFADLGPAEVQSHLNVFALDSWI